MADYKSVILRKIAELEAQRDHIQLAIALLKQLVEGSEAHPKFENWLREMSLREGICAVLAHEATVLTSGEIHQALLDGGYVFKSGDHRLSVNQALHELGKSGVISKVGYGKWSSKNG